MTAVDARPVEPDTVRVGFIGLGNVGGKLAGSLLRNGVDLTVRDLDDAAVARFVDGGATAAPSPRALAEGVDVVITCLPSPAASAAVMESDDGVLAGLRPGAVWMEMSTTDEAEIRRLGALVTAAGGSVVDCPVSGGCHRAATGNISILAGCDRVTFDRVLPLLTVLGRQVMHTGDLGSASVLKVMTNYLATANLVSLCEALATMEAAGVDLGVTYEAIRISSGNSFVHETESQLILNGSRDISFTMDLVSKDIGLFQDLADRFGVTLDINPMLIELFRDSAERYGARAQSDEVIRRWEDASGRSITAPGFPAELVDTEPEVRGHEVRRG